MSEIHRRRTPTSPTVYICTVAVMSSVADMSSDVIGFTEPIISCVLSNNTQHKTGN